MFEAEVTALEGAQAIADLAVLTGLQFDRQGQVFEAQAVRHVVENLYVQWLSEVMLDLQSHFTPSTECQAAGHLSLEAGRGQAFEADGVEYCQGQQCQQQSPVDRQQARWNGEFQCPQRAQHDADGQQDREPDQQQARGLGLGGKDRRSHRFTGAAPALDRAVA